MTYICLRVNIFISKTKSMILSNKADSYNNPPLFLKRKKKLDQVKSFKYLGLLITQATSSATLDKYFGQKVSANNVFFLCKASN